MTRSRNTRCVLVILSVFGVDSVQKYHSIHKSGKSLEDALSEEELKVLREYVAVITSHPAINHARDYGEFIEETETPSGAAAETNGDADRQDAEMIHAESNGITDVDQAEAQQQVRIDQRCHYRTLSDTTQEPNPSQQQHIQQASAEIPARQDGAPTSSMPATLLGTGTSPCRKILARPRRCAETLTGNALTIVSTRRKHEEHHDVLVLCWLLHGAACGTAAGAQGHSANAVD
jgi:hypothetical protein